MSPLKGIGFKLISVMTFVVMASLVKATSEHVPPGQAVFFRSFFAIPVIIGWLWARGDLSTGGGGAHSDGGHCGQGGADKRTV